MTNTEVRLALVEQNYQNLDARLDKVEQKIDVLHSDIKNSNVSLVKVIVGAAGTIVAGCFSVVITILMKF
jgi:tetrahydromethanopterin S-methyltransferase subunit G